MTELKHAGMDPVGKHFPASTPRIGRTKECKDIDPVRHGRVNHRGICGDPMCSNIEKNKGAASNGLHPSFPITFII
jgi:hypothetical protein